MTDTAQRPRGVRALHVLSRIPVTLSLVAAIIVVGLISQGLWRPIENGPIWDWAAYGLPAFAEGRVWTVVTGTFLVSQPWVFLLVLPTFIGMGFLEWRRGARVATAYFAGGQLVAVFGTALLLWLGAMLPWPWAQAEAQVLDVGASGGALTCVAAAVGLLPSPWRQRAWMVLLAFVLVPLLFWAGLPDLEHAIGVAMVLLIDRSLRPARSTVREQRFVAFVALVAIGVVEIVVLLVPVFGPFGTSDPTEGSFIDVGIDLALIVVVAPSLLRGRRWAWIVAVIGAAMNVLTLATFVLVFLLGGWDELVEVFGSDPTVSAATAALWLPMLVYLFWVRGAFKAHRRASIGSGAAPEVTEVATALRNNGGGTLSWMTTWPGNDYVRTRSGGIVAYRRRAGVALALADPIAPAGALSASVNEFIEDAERAGLIPCFFSADERTRAAVPSGWRNLIVADDTIVDLPGLEFTGKRWSAVRGSFNRADREEMRFRLTHFEGEPWGVRQQLRGISEMWVGDKGLPEMGFTLGTLEEARDPEVRLALAVAPSGDVDGFLTWLPVYGDSGTIHGWTLDLMRRRDGGFGPVMEFLIGSSARQFSEEGAQLMSLSGAPLAHDYPPDAGAIAALSDKLAETLEPVYGFRSLHRFKEKFNPRYETLYLLYGDEGDLPRIGAALTRAFLPDATMRQFASAGLELIRGGRD